MTITKKTVADRIAAYLHHEITLAQLVDWSEQAMLDGEFAESDAGQISAVVARLGVADVRAFGLTWEDCEDLLRKLGFAPRVEVVAA
jgi:cobyrinic acid a,c-diamide synthase